MNVEHILAAKGRDVLTIEPDRTLADAARALTERKIGAVVIADAGASRPAPSRRTAAPPFAQASHSPKRPVGPPQAHLRWSTR